MIKFLVRTVYLLRLLATPLPLFKTKALKSYANAFLLAFIFSFLLSCNKNDSFGVEIQPENQNISGQFVDDATLTEILGCPFLANLYQLVIDIKYDLMDSFIINDAPTAYLPNGKETDGEGYVFHSDTYGTVKLVKRGEFAYANFNHGFGS